jgi:UPF0271 protein
LTPPDRRVIVLDTSAFIAGFDPLSVADQVYSVPSVERELVSSSLPWTRFKTAIEIGKLRVKTPTQKFLQRVKESSKTVGDVLFLSEVDFQVLALALELKSLGYSPLVVTDDYSIQNVSDQVDIEFASLMTFGIRFRHHWIMYCPACFHKYPPDYQDAVCEVCGTKLKRKPLRKTLVRQ